MATVMHVKQVPVVFGFHWNRTWILSCGEPDIVHKLAEYDGVSISDAECVDVLLQQIVLELEVIDLHHKKGVPFFDNTPTVSRVTCVASKQSGTGDCLKRGIAFRVRGRRMCLPEALSVSGDAN